MGYQYYDYGGKSSLEPYYGGGYYYMDGYYSNGYMYYNKEGYDYLNPKY